MRGVFDQLPEVERFVNPLEGVLAHGPGLALVEVSKLPGLPEVCKNGLGPLRALGMPVMHPVRIIGIVSEEGKRHGMAGVSS